MNFKSFAVIGLGRFGMEIATKLYDAGKDVLAVDCREEAVNAVADHATRAASADAKNRKALEALGVRSCDCAIVAIGEDIAASVMVSMNLRAIGVKYIVCKASNETHSDVLHALGVDQVIIPEHEVADRLARNLVSRNILEYIELSDDYAIIERPVPRDWADSTIIDLNIRAEYGVNIIAVKRGEDVTVSPSAMYCLHSGDTLVLLGSNEDLRKLEKLRA